MTKVNLELDLSDEQDKEIFEIAFKGKYYKYTISDFMAEVRAKTKHSEDEMWCEHAEYWRDYIIDRLSYWMDDDYYI